MNVFKKAEKAKSKLRLAIYGPSGSGKTMSSLLIAQGLGGRIALIDTERRSASKYSDRVEFDVLELERRTIEDYIQGIDAAGQAGYEVLIIDSLSHAWAELVEEIDRLAENPKYKGNSFRAWAQGTPKQKRFVDAILKFPGHIIGTMRSSTEWAVEVNQQGKPTPRKLGLKPEQGKGIEYEFDLLMSIGPEHWVTVEKDRTGKYQDQQIEKPGIAFGRELAQWLETGTETQPAHRPAEALKMAEPILDAPKPEIVPPEVPKQVAAPLASAQDRKRLGNLFRRLHLSTREAQLDTAYRCAGVTDPDLMTADQCARLIQRCERSLSLREKLRKAGAEIDQEGSVIINGAALMCGMAVPVDLWTITDEEFTEIMDCVSAQGADILARGGAA